MNAAESTGHKGRNRRATVSPRMRLPLRVGLLCGQMAALEIVIAIAVASYAGPGLSTVSNTISDLGEQGRSTAWIIQVGLVLMGGLLLAFSAALSIVAPPIIRWSVRGIRVFGTAIVMTGVFQDYNPTNHSPHNYEGFIHNTFGVAAIVAIAFAMVGLARRDRASEPWNGLVTLSRACLLVIVVNGALFLWGPASLQGIVERVMYAAAILWIAAVSRIAVIVGGQSHRAKVNGELARMALIDKSHPAGT